MYMKLTRGTTRIVFIFRRFVVKIPNFTYSQQNFLKGCLANYNERWFCRKFKGIEDFESLVIPSTFCSWFGIILIQKRAATIIDKSMLKDLDSFRKVCDDIKPQNFGMYKGRIVCIDYG